MSAEPLYMVTWEGTSPVIMARMGDDTDTDLTQAGLTNITYYIYDTEDNSLAVEDAEITVGDVVYDTLQTGNGWSKDGDGYNFRWKIDEALLPNAAAQKRYRVELVFVLNNATADKAFIVAMVDRKNLLSQSAS